MIVVTRLNDSRFAINPDLIERIHATPDTTIVLIDGAKYIVTESMDEVIEMIARYRARVIGLARGYKAMDERRDDPPAGHPMLGLVRDSTEPLAAGVGTVRPHRDGRS